MDCQRLAQRASESQIIGHPDFTTASLRTRLTLAFFASSRELRQNFLMSVALLYATLNPSLSALCCDVVPP
jgi:hypothetical protein